jgi:DNA invertase Pin-like site-specific DNA recombinase
MPSKTKSRKFAYVRVSHKEQNVARQLIALKPFHIPKRNIIIEKKSGKNFEREGYQDLIARMRAGDILYIKAIDRLGRNYREIIEQWQFLTREKKIDIIVLDMPLLDTTYCKDLLGMFIADLVLQVLSFVAQMERDNLLQRQAEGIAAAKAKGVKFGNSRIADPANFEAIFSQWANGMVSDQAAAKLCGFSVRTLYRRRAERQG